MQHQKLLRIVIVGCFVFFLSAPLFAQQEARLEEQTRVVQDTLQQIRNSEIKKKEGDVHLRGEDPEKAVEAYRSAIKIAPKYQKMTYRVKLAVALAHAGKYEEARKELTTFLSDTHAWLDAHKSTKGQVLFYLGFTNYYLGQIDDAENFFKLQIEFLKVQEPVTLNYLGLIKTLQKKYDKAERYFNDAIRRASPTQRPLYQLNLAEAYLTQEKWQKAYDLLKISRRFKDAWNKRSVEDRAILDYDYALAAHKLNKTDISQPLFERLAENPALPSHLQYQANVFLGRAKPVEEAAAVAAKPWSALLRTSVQYDNNVGFLPGEGPFSFGGAEDSVGYSVLISPQYAAPLSSNLYFDTTAYFYYIYHQDRSVEQDDLLSGTVEAWLRMSHKRQRFDLGARVDLPFFNTDGMDLFYQRYGIIPTWNIFWTDWFGTRLYGETEIVEYRKDSPNRVNQLDGMIYSVGTEQTVLFFDYSWRVRFLYEFSYEEKEGDNFEARKHKIQHEVTSARIGPFQVHYRGSIIFSDYPNYVPDIFATKRKDWRYEYFWNLNINLSPSVGLNGNILWLNNHSKHPAYEYEKVVYEGGLFFIF
ncbi:tetratricopeptide repeat protein [Bdellovibrionota bacterium]